MFEGQNVSIEYVGVGSKRLVFPALAADLSIKVAGFTTLATIMPRWQPRLLPPDDPIVVMTAVDPIETDLSSFQPSWRNYHGIRIGKRRDIGKALHFFIFTIWRRGGYCYLDFSSTYHPTAAFKGKCSSHQQRRLAVQIRVVTASERPRLRYRFLKRWLNRRPRLFCLAPIASSASARTINPLARAIGCRPSTYTA